MAQSRITASEPIAILRADIRKAAAELSEKEARYLVDLYYQIQDFRKGTGNEIGALERLKEPQPKILVWSFGQMEAIENEIKLALNAYTDRQPMGAWAKEVVGIGPVIAAGLLAHIEFRPWKCIAEDDEEKRCNRLDPFHRVGCGPRELTSVGAIWRFAGLDPTRKWEKKQKRPFNARLKTLCWKIGESFVKVSGNPKSLYGRLYSQRKAIEIKNNDARRFAKQAEAILETKNIGTKTVAYAHYVLGKLPPDHIHSRAKRWAVKVFLCHYYEEGCRRILGKEPPLVYSLAMLGHVDKIEPEAKAG